jgi:hypothetical protein
MGIHVPTKTKSTTNAPNEDAVRQRAYLMWEADGRPDGLADHYWLKASEVPAAANKPTAKAKNAASKTPAAAAVKTKASKPAKAPVKKTAKKA